MAFKRAGPEWEVHPCKRMTGLSCDIPVLELTSDDGTSVKTDFAGYTVDVVHWVRGTNTLLYTHRPWPDVQNGIGANFHGSATHGAVSDACPACYVLVVQDYMSIDGEMLRIMAEELPWVDFVTQTNFPGPPELPGGSPSYTEASRVFADRGRIAFFAAGNTPVAGFGGLGFPFPFMDMAFPPWQVMVGGAHSACHGTELNAGKPNDFVGNYTQALPALDSSTERLLTSGTSFATPHVAGAFGQALFEIRAQLPPRDSLDGLWNGAPQAGTYLADGRLDPSELREAMGRAATYFSPTQFEPFNCPYQTAFGNPLPASPTPWVEMGWGFLGAPESSRVADAVLGSGTLAEKPLAATSYMAALESARMALYP